METRPPLPPFTLETARQQQRLSKPLQAKLELAVAESDQLLVTFSALLRIAQIESGSRKKAFTRVNLSALCEKVFNIYQAVAEDDAQRFVEGLVALMIGEYRAVEFDEHGGIRVQAACSALGSGGLSRSLVSACDSRRR